MPTGKTLPNLEPSTCRENRHWHYCFDSICFGFQTYHMILLGPLFPRVDFALDFKVPSKTSTPSVDAASLFHFHRQRWTQSGKRCPGVKSEKSHKKVLSTEGVIPCIWVINLSDWLGWTSNQELGIVIHVAVENHQKGGRKTSSSSAIFSHSVTRCFGVQRIFDGMFAPVARRFPVYWLDGVGTSGASANGPGLAWLLSSWKEHNRWLIQPCKE